MRNLKKLLAVIVAICVLATFTVPAFAAESFTYETQATKLYDMGLFQGGSTSEYVPALEKDLTREAGMTLLVRLFGKEADALAMTDADTVLATYADADKVSTWAKKYVAFAIKTGLVIGDGKNVYPAEALTGEAFATMILRNLGVTVDAEGYKVAVASLQTKGGLTADEATKFAGKSLNRDDAVGIMFGSLQAKDADGKTVIEKLVASGAVTAEKAIAAGVYTAAPATLAVTDITSTNLKEIVVKYNRPVTEEVKAEYYTVSSSSKIAVALSEDKTAVTITETTTSAAFGANQAQVDVTVKKGQGLAADYTKKVTLLDVTLPVANSIKLTGPNTFEITFSEPMLQNAGGSISVNNGVYGVTNYLADGTAVVKVKLSASTLAEGTYKVMAKGYKDAAGYQAMDKEFDLVYVKDTTAPTATVKSFTQKEVVIEFNKPVTTDGTAKLTADNFYHTFTTYKPTAVAVSSDDKTFTVDFSNRPLQEGKVKVVLVYNANSKEVRDGWGNKLTANLEFMLDVSADKIAPEVTEIKATAQNTLEVYFSEKLLESAAETTANYTIKDADQKDVTINTVVYDDTNKKVTITTTKDMNGKITVAFKDITDTALEGNKIVAITKELTVSDVTKPLLTSITAVTVDGATEDYIYVTFPEKMATTGQYSVLNKDNYLVSGAALGSDDTITIFGDESKVKITLVDETKYTGSRVVAVARLADAAGNASAALSNANIVAGMDTAPVITAIKTISKNTLEITFSTILNSYPADGIMVGKVASPDAIAGNLAAVSKADKDGKTTLTATLKAEVNLANSSDVSSIVVGTVGSKLVSDTGSYVANQLVTATGSLTIGGIGFTNTSYSTPVAITDGFKPSLSSASTTAAAVTAVIDLTFDETMAVAAGQATAAHDFIVKYDGSELTAINDYSTAIVGGTVVRITVTKSDMAAGKKITVVLKSTVNYLKDAAGNTPNAFDAKEITLQ